MKEIHAYLNKDGTYQLEAISQVYDGSKMVDVRMKVARAKISVEALAEPSLGELYTVIIDEEN